MNCGEILEILQILIRVSSTQNQIQILLFSGYISITDSSSANKRINKCYKQMLLVKDES